MALISENEPQEDSKPSFKSNYPSETHTTSSSKPDPLQIDKPIVALQLLTTAIKLQDLQLAKQCVENLNNRLNETNVLLVLKHLSQYTDDPGTPADRFAPSAPPEGDHWARDLVDNLRNNCYQAIDGRADFVLAHKDVVELGYGDLLSIATRDTLEASSELLVYSAVMRWAVERSKRMSPEAQKVHLRAVLGDLVYAPRYGLMTKKEFLCRTVDGVKGPDRSGVLEESESERILGYIRKKGVGGELPRGAGVPRKRPSRGRGELGCGRRSGCERFLINFLACWTAVFD
ncbi:unnamed protein product [Phyllotreta striolata]|uniref:BACK domain-containing protein n=1 Tax=Phyllotreta striolata TaxID=444603 RepID=A0A9N9TIP7_PHYSR|nr:unnamed protein product [Phyllotreta striolata]